MADNQDLLFFVNEAKPEFVLASIGFTQGDIDKMQAALDKAPEREKGKVANLQVLRSKQGKLYAKIDDFTPNKTAPVNSGATAPEEDDLPF